MHSQNKRVVRYQQAKWISILQIIFNLLLFVQTHLILSCLQNFFHAIPLLKILYLLFRQIQWNLHSASSNLSYGKNSPRKILNLKSRSNIRNEITHLLNLNLCINLLLIGITSQACISQEIIILIWMHRLPYLSLSQILYMIYIIYIDK